MLGAFLVRIEHIQIAVGNEVFKAVILFFEVQVFGDGEYTAPVLVAARTIVNEEHGETVRVLVGKRLKKNVIENAEYHGGCADAQRECEDCKQGEAAIFAQPSESIAQVLPKPVQTLHFALPCASHTRSLMTYRL